MDLVLKCGLMEQSMKETGIIIRQMEEANSGMQMEMYMKVNGSMIKLMAMESMFM